MLSVKARIDQGEEKRKKETRKKKRQTEKKKKKLRDSLFFLLFDGIEAVRHAANQLE